MQVHKKKKSVYVCIHFHKSKSVYGLEIKEIQDQRIPRVNTMVLAHNIERSNGYLIPSKNTTCSKCCFGPRYWGRPKPYKEEKIKGPSVKVKGFLRNTSNWSIFYVAGAMIMIWFEIFCASWVQCWIRIMRPEMT